MNQGTEGARAVGERRVVQAIVERCERIVGSFEARDGHEKLSSPECAQLFADLAKLQIYEWPFLSTNERMNVRNLAGGFEGRLIEFLATGGTGIEKCAEAGIGAILEGATDAVLTRWVDDVLEGDAPIHTYYEFEDEVLTQLDLVGFALIECERLGIGRSRENDARIRTSRSNLYEHIVEIAKRLQQEDEVPIVNSDWAPKEFWWRHF